MSTTSFASPYEPYYTEPVYDADNPGNILYEQQIRTGQKNNFSINGGITATFSIPLDRHHVRTCRAAAEKQVALLEAKIAHERMVYEIKRLKNCSDLMKDGIMFHPSSPYRKICADVVLTNPPGTLPPHTHPITYPKPASDREWLDSGDAAAPVAPVRIPVSPYGQASD
jgi:arylamine N-acetyltransferase